MIQIFDLLLFAIELALFGSNRSSIAHTKFWLFSDDKPPSDWLFNDDLIHISYKRIMPFGLAGLRTPTTAKLEFKEINIGGNWSSGLGKF